MTGMAVRQMFHIFWKDVRALRLDIGLVAVLSAFHAWAFTHTANPLWAEGLLGATVLVFVPRLIQMEAPVGDRQFWLTRPYHRTSLLAAKVMGLVCFAGVPVLADRVFVVWAAGFPLGAEWRALLCSQWLIVFGVLAPAAALAAMTSGLIPYLFSLLGLGAMSLAVDAALAPPLATAVRLSLSASEWIWIAAAGVSVGLGSLAVLWLQYGARRTMWSRWVGALAVIIGAGAYLFLPWTVAARVQSWLSADRFPAEALRFRLRPEERQFFPRGTLGRNGRQVDLPVEVTGLPATMELATDGAELALEWADGRRWASGSYGYPAIAKARPGTGTALVHVDVDVPEPYFSNLEERVRLRARFYFTVFDKGTAVEIPVGRPTVVPRGLQCGAEAFHRLSCVAMFRWPGRLVGAAFGEDGMVPMTRVVSYSPLPAGVSLGGFERRSVPIPSGAQRVRIVQKEVLAHLRRDWVVDDFPLEALSVRVVGSARRE